MNVIARPSSHANFISEPYHQRSSFKLVQVLAESEKCSVCTGDSGAFQVGQRLSISSVSIDDELT